VTFAVPFLTVVHPDRWRACCGAGARNRAGAIGFSRDILPRDRSQGYLRTQ